MNFNFCSPLKYLPLPEKFLRTLMVVIIFFLQEDQSNSLFYIEEYRSLPYSVSLESQFCKIWNMFLHLLVLTLWIAVKQNICVWQLTNNVCVGHRVLIFIPVLIFWLSNYLYTSRYAQLKNRSGHSRTNGFHNFLPGIILLIHRQFQ